MTARDLIDGLWFAILVSSGVLFVIFAGIIMECAL